MMQSSTSQPTASLLTFFVLAFAWSWTCWLLASAFKVDAPIAAIVLSLAASIGPSLAAVLVMSYSNGRAGLRVWLARCLLGRFAWRWALLAFLFPLVLMAMAAAAHIALGGTLPPSPAARHVAMTALNIVLMFFVGGPLGEEFGWRGYALPALQVRMHWRIASVLLGVIWALWHLPLFYSAGTVQSHLPIGLYALSVIASSVLFAWLFNRSDGSIVPVLMLHTAVNDWSLIIPVMVQADGSNLRPFQIVVGFQVLTAIALLCTPDRVNIKQKGT